MYERVEVLCDALCIVGESPLWDARRRRLYMVDIHGRRIRTVDYVSGAVHDWVMPQQTGALVLSKKDELLACMEDGVYVIGETGEMKPLFAPLPLAGPRFNDVKAGPDGALWGGTIHYGGQGALYRLTPAGELQTLLEGVGNANGLDWDTEKGAFYFNDTPTMRTSAYAWDAAAGTIHSPRAVRTYIPGEGNPDGMTLDAEGMLWVALWGGGHVLRLNPEDGAVLDEIVLPVSNVACCAFAGEDLRDLVITTAAHATSLREQPLAGAVFRARVEVPGRLPYRFG